MSFIEIEIGVGVELTSNIVLDFDSDFDSQDYEMAIPKRSYPDAITLSA